MTTVKGRKARIESKERGKRRRESWVRVERKSHEKSKYISDQSFKEENVGLWRKVEVKEKLSLSRDGWLNEWRWNVKEKATEPGKCEGVRNIVCQCKMGWKMKKWEWRQCNVNSCEKKRFASAKQENTQERLQFKDVINTWEELIICWYNLRGSANPRMSSRGWPTSCCWWNWQENGYERRDQRSRFGTSIRSFRWVCASTWSPSLLSAHFAVVVVVVTGHVGRRSCHLNTCFSTT